MATDPKNHGKPWSDADLQEFRELAQANTPTLVIGLKSGRTPPTARQKASSENISLKPTHQRPYGTNKK
ncbi:MULTISPECIES: hypothetical protein [Thiomonas]|uniref:hypothetical protein n=1 Tax=Thiomonas TaxID=32012 RepID=UPI0007D6E4E6|nr:MULTISPECIES: hypothetical protein [Thiomonas]